MGEGIGASTLLVVKNPHMTLQSAPPPITDVPYPWIQLTVDSIVHSMHLVKKIRGPVLFKPVLFKGQM